MKDLFFSNTNLRRLLYSVTVMSLMAAVFWFGVNTPATEAGAKGDDSAVPQTAFPANAGTLGSIPDGPAACSSYGANRDVTFTVAGMSAPLSNVAVSITLSPAHTWVGDLDVRLKAPGGSPEHILFSRTGAATATAAGSLNDVAGPYSFVDTAPASPTWWSAAAAATTPIPTGSYRTSTAGEVAGGGANTLMTPAFAGLTTPQINGTWTLTFRDHCSADVGTVSAATLTLDAAVTAPAQHVVDFDGDGRTDPAVVRNTGGGMGGQVGWFFNTNPGAGPTTWYAWGISTDFFVPEDYDGDSKTDLAVWRPSTGVFYILQSLTNTARIEAFGQSNDDPTVVGDYNNDNKADLAVYRSGVNTGDASTWYYRATPGGPIAFIPWGQNGDFPAPGDYDGDGSNDFVIQRNNGSGQGAFWTRLATGATPAVIIFGTSSDAVLPGDYDGDGKTDIAVARDVGGSINWFWRPSGGGADVLYVPFGVSSTDTLTQGDWDDDGKTDLGIWRSSVTPGASTFWYRRSIDGVAVSIPFGALGDYPVANYNQH